jgi:prepilin peptidase CpaA
MQLPDLLRVLLVVVSCAAGIIDIRSRRIPNWLCAAGLVAGFACRFYLQGAPGLLIAAEGLGLACLIYFPLWMLRGMGAGDVKLMAALGAIAGPAHWFVLFLVSAILGAILALFVALRYGRMGSTVVNTFFLAKELVLFRAPWKALPQTDFRHADALRIPHGAVIAAAALVLAALGRM